MAAVIAGTVVGNPNRRMPTNSSVARIAIAVAGELWRGHKRGYAQRRKSQIGKLGLNGWRIRYDRKIRRHATRNLRHGRLNLRAERMRQERREKKPE